MLYRIQNTDSGEFFVLTQNGTLTADFNSTLFNAQADLLGSYTYPGTMPLEPNRSKIRNAHYVATDSALRTINAMMWLGALPFKQVKMYFTIEKQVINYNLYYDIAFITNELKTIKLNNLSDPLIDDQFNATSFAGLKAHMSTVAKAVPLVYPYTFFPWKNEAAYIDAAYVTTPAYASGTAYGVDVEFTYTDNRIYKVLIATTAGMTPVSNPDHFQDVTVYPDIKLPVSKIINRWELDSMGNGYFNVDPNFPISQTQVPAFYLVYVLKRICNFFGFKPIGQILSDPNFMRKVVWSNVPILAPIIPDYWLLMPDILVSDFLKEVRSRFSLMIDFDVTRKVAIIESLANLETTGDICDLQQLETLSYRETGTQSQAFTIEEIADDKDASFSDADRNNPNQLIVGTPATAIQVTDIQLNSAPTKMIIEQSAVDITATLPLVTNWRIPWIKMPMAGTSPLDQVSSLLQPDRSSFKLRFLDYHGMQQDDSGYLYPYASSDELDQSGAVISTDTLSLTPTGTTFLSIKHYFEFQANSKPAEWVFEMSPQDYQNIAPNKRFIVRDPYNRSNAIDALLDQNSADFEGNKEKIVAKLTLYPVIRPDNKVEIIPPAVITPPPPPPDNGAVFVRLSIRNVTSYDVEFPTPAFGHKEDLFAEFFEDAGATTPKNVTSLDVRFRIQLVEDGDLSGTITSFVTVSCTSTTDETQLGNQVDQSETTGGHSFVWTYALMPSAHYTII